MNVVDAIKRAVVGEADVVAPKPHVPRETVFARFRRLHGIDAETTWDSIATEPVQRVRSGLPPGRVTFVGPQRTPVAVQYAYPLLAAFDARREQFERELANAVARAHALRDNFEIGGWASEDAFGAAQAEADRLREHVREMNIVATVSQFIAYVIALRDERATLAALEPEAPYVPVSATVVERPANVTRHPMREPDAYDKLQAMERVRASRMNALLAPESSEYSRAKSEVARLEGRIRAW